MVVSKRCKICTIIEVDNMPISGEYFGRKIPEMIEKISGIVLDPRKLVDVLICQQCAIQLVHTESVVNKLCRSMARLAGKPKAAAKTPSKVPTPIRKKKENPIVAPSPKSNGDNGFKKFSDDLDESVLKVDESTPAKKKKSTKRKLDDSQLGGIDDTLNNGEISNIHDVKNSDDGNDPNETTFLDGEKKRKKTSESHSDTLEEMQKNVTTADEELQTTKTKDINCVLCGKRFSQKSLLREHIELSHMGEKLKECPNCSMEFRSLQKYESHVFGEKCKGTLHPCQFDNCHRRFKNVHKMEIHMRQKHLSISEDLE